MIRFPYIPVAAIFIFSAKEERHLAIVGVLYVYICMYDDHTLKDGDLRARCYSCNSLKTEQPTSPFAQWINDQGTEEKSNSDTDCDLNHTEPNVKNDCIQIIRVRYSDL